MEKWEIFQVVLKNLFLHKCKNLNLQDGQDNKFLQVKLH